MVRRVHAPDGSPAGKDDMAGEALDLRLQLLGRFTCSIDGEVTNLPAIPRAMIAHIALGGRSLERRALEQILWPGLDRATATKRLSQILWRVRDATGDSVVAATDTGISLRPGVTVDWEHAEALARKIAAFGAGEQETSADPARWSPLKSLLLPDHTCSAARAAQLSWNHLRLLALNRLAEAFLSAGDPVTAVDFAASAIQADELTEWPYLIIANAHLTRGDVGMARRVVNGYLELLKKHCDLPPSVKIQAYLRRFKVAV
jgi:DNA-binding SARP family transcriptional activator